MNSTVLFRKRSPFVGWLTTDAMPSHLVPWDETFGSLAPASSACKLAAPKSPLPSVTAFAIYR